MLVHILDYEYNRATSLFIKYTDFRPGSCVKLCICESRTKKGYIVVSQVSDEGYWTFILKQSKINIIDWQKFLQQCVNRAKFKDKHKLEKLFIFDSDEVREIFSF